LLSKLDFPELSRAKPGLTGPAERLPLARDFCHNVRIVQHHLTQEFDFMAKGKYPLGDAAARRAARKQRKTQRSTARKTGGQKAGATGK
jgi:hypothetical protein